MLTQERLKEVINYNPDTGIFTWVLHTRNTKPGYPAGGIDITTGYVRIAINRKHYQAHRLAVLYMEGYFPEHTVDHKDRVRHHNWYDNLREATKQCQMRNCGMLRKNTSGVKGVHWHDKRSKWAAQIAVNRVISHIGLFASLEEACYHRFAAEQCLGFQDCDTNSSAKQYIDAQNKK
jgi:hypothetical protein